MVANKPNRSDGKHIRFIIARAKYPSHTIQTNESQSQLQSKNARHPKKDNQNPQPTPKDSTQTETNATKLFGFPATTLSPTQGTIFFHKIPSRQIEKHPTNKNVEHSSTC
ncbi:hypothetical protein MA16_Dca009207 [Dendrobium catenatum]|uniref:Uncharacterized protein n=1 Tax=Dendrobium catenatum TaxID=906689 RepID=A0A2I0VR43_9ASPA|nr:hypothetical protein MA16_Dca009207 [Dendrobium catenatum]